MNDDKYKAIEKETLRLFKTFNRDKGSDRDLSLIIIRQLWELEQQLTQIRNQAFDEVLSGIEREINYHTYIDQRGAEMRHPISALKELAGYVRALKESKS